MPIRPPLHQPEHIRLRPKRTTTARNYDSQRGNSNDRGYGGRWRKVRRIKLARSPLCVDCEKAGRTTPATEVHHKIPLTTRPDMAYDLDNLESLCKSCHNRREGRVGGGGGESLEANLC